MNRKYPYLPLIAVLSLLFARSSFAQGTAFFYQGQLQSGGAGTTGHYDFAFTVYNAVTNGSAVSGTLTNFDVPVNNGLFTTTLDFGANIFTGSSVWLDISVRSNGVITGFTELSPRQPVLAVPYAIFANSASNLVGTSAVTLTNGANIFAGTFSGNGGGVTNVSVTNLTGVLVDAQLPTNTAYLNSNQTFTANNIFNGTNTFNGSNTFNGANIFTNLYGNSFSGSFFGNGLVGWVVVPGTTVQAQIDHGYLLTNFQVVTVTLPTGLNAGDIVRVAGAGATGWQVAQNASQSVLGNLVIYGKTWTQSPQLENWTSIASSSDGTKMVAAAYGTGIFISVNSGSTWNESFSTAGQYVGVASSSDGSHLAAVATNGGAIYLSTDSGSSWPAITGTSGPGFNWTSVALSASGNLLVAANNGTGLYVYSGTTLQHTFSSSPNNWLSVASSANGSNLVAAAFNSSIYTSTNAGASWQPTSSGSKQWRAVASSADGSKLVAVVNNGGIYTSINSGGNWAATSAPTESWTSVASSSDGSKLIAVSGAGIFTSANWGGTWMLQTNNAPAAANWLCAASSSSGGTLAAGIYSTLSGGIYNSIAAAQTSSTTGTNGYISGSQGSAVELQYIGNNQFMPVSSVGTIWGN